MKIQDILLSEAYQYRLDPRSSADNAIAEFKHGEGGNRTTQVAIEINAYDYHEVKFYPKEKAGEDDEFELDSSGDANQVFKTVSNIIDEWYSRNKENVNAVVGVLSSNNEAKRSRIYAIILGRLKQKHGGTVEKKADNVIWHTPQLKNQFDDEDEYDDYSNY